jgi:3-methyl-2-oxobutanoate hydroxymethyltransferase
MAASSAEPSAPAVVRPRVGRVSVPQVASYRTGPDSPPLVMVTAYDAPGAKAAHQAGVDLILVGDSLAMVVLGYDDTLQVTTADMAHHTAAVARGLKASVAAGVERPRPLVVGDLPWMSYHTGPQDAVRNAAELIRAGADCVRLRA